MNPIPLSSYIWRLIVALISIGLESKTISDVVFLLSKELENVVNSLIMYEALSHIVHPIDSKMGL